VGESSKAVAQNMKETGSHGIYDCMEGFEICECQWTNEDYEKGSMYALVQTDKKVQCQ